MTTADEHEQDHLAARILVVDDNPINLEVLSELLEMTGYTQVTLESNPVHAIDHWRTQDFDLLLLDIRMPQMSGHEVMAELKKDLGPNEYLPCIVLTAQTDTDTQQKALSAGAIDFITKPFNFDELLKRLKNALNNRLIHRRQKQQLNEFGQRIDAQQRALAEKEHDLAYLATHDSVTGLLNRRALMTHLRQMLDESPQAITCLLIEVTDSDQLLLIEGVDSVDLFLRTVATRLKSVLDDHLGICGVWGGQTFLCLLPVQAKMAEPIVQRMMTAVFAPVEQIDFDISLHGRCGYAEIELDDDGTFPPRSADEAIRRAGFALASLSKNGNELSRFSPIMAEVAFRRHQLERDLSVALTQPEQFFLVYQPKVDLVTETIVGCEALVRWQHPKHGLIPPMEFISLAEEKGQIVELGMLVIEHALRFVRQMIDTTGYAIPVAVNVSGYQFELMHAKKMNLVTEIQRRLQQYQIEPRWLEVEITETALMSRFDLVVKQLVQLRDIGITVALDDFGTGYSSFSYLQKLPITTLKIDRSFVDKASADTRQTTLRRSIIVMAKALDLCTVAEGVETLADINLLKNLRCPLAQGYYYSRPLDASAMLALLRLPGKIQPAQG
ncbi:EAL domain-containing protein [Halothiobacillus sp.]|uniref:GGDEF/EAL domain-containing response regulator n=1 Tax=Halothiobacillus sp. TaxID=1891311 RepID=UPI002AD50A8F|nr:EAL domain-containing protein [Halothiobacillus sp.]